MPNFAIIKQNILASGYNALNKFDKTLDYNPDVAIATSVLGTPIYSNLVLKQGSFTDPVDGRIIDYPSLQLDAVIFHATRNKNFTESTIQGRDGSVKELISNYDYQISITGSLFSTMPNKSPREEKSVLAKICAAKTSVEVVSQFLNDLGVYNLVIYNYSFEEVKSFRNMMNFSLNCTSDLPYDLEISKAI